MGVRSIGRDVMSQLIGCLGAARIAPDALCHPARAVGGARLYAVAARDPARARAFAQAYGFERALEGYDALIADPQVSLVYNPLPTSLHAHWTLRALEAGKHVLCEKPFAMNAQEAGAVCDAAEANGVCVVEAFHYRYHPAFRILLDWVSAGRIGEVTAIEASFTAPIEARAGTEIRHLPETGGGAFMDLGCYPLHWARTIMGAEPERVEASADLTPRGVDETLQARLVFPGGAVAQLSASMATDVARGNDLEVRGRTGRIRFRNALAPHLGARLTLETSQQCETAPISRVSTYAFQLAAVIEALEGDKTLPTGPRDILAQQQAIDAIYAAAGLGHLRSAAPV